MSVSATLEDCLRNKGSRYEILRHPHSHTSMDTAQAAHIPGDQLAKTVLLQDEFGYVATVLPSTYHVRLSEMRKRTGRHLILAGESGMRELFKDCELGAVPPVCTAYGMQTYLDESLMRQPDIYFEVGDHEQLIHMNIDQFLDLMAEAQTVQCAHRTW
ncbi:aminoacyl-tRNA deacylase [Undibacterium arcticum]|uniref:Aminoacyl-tRNA deacylase n=1 Tax=Undibacterium arcticum TaxID=1762892 RepID=A0ABV7EWA6_9BURK